MPRGRDERTLRIGEKDADIRLAEARRLFEHGVPYGREVAGRGIDDLENLAGRGLLLQRFVALGKCRIEALLQLNVRTPKFGYLIIERRGHVVLRRALLLATQY